MLSFSRFICGMVIWNVCMAQTPAPGETQHPSDAPALDNRDSAAEAGKNGPALHSVGVKGTIDSGGYSASAAAKSQSELAGDMLRLQRRELSAFYRSSGASCSQEGQTLDSSARIRMGLAAESQGRFDSAEEQFRLTSASSPSEQSFFAWGTALIITGHSDRAVDAFKAAVSRFPKSTALTIGLGAATYGEGDSSDALKILVRGAEMDPKNGAAYIFMARIFNNVGVETTGMQVEEMKRLVDMAPDNAEANFAYACSLKSVQKTDAPRGPQSREVEELLKRSIALEPRFADAHFQLATLYGERGEYERAIEEYRKAIEANPNLVEAHYRLGQAYLRAGQRDQAERELEIHQRLREAQNQGLPAANTDTASLCPAP